MKIHCKVGVITGAEKAFCAGADLKTYTMDFAAESRMNLRKICKWIWIGWNHPRS